VRNQQVYAADDLVMRRRAAFLELPDGNLTLETDRKVAEVGMARMGLLGNSPVEQGFFRKFLTPASTPRPVRFSVAECWGHNPGTASLPES
jgi:hypothetical protein